MNQDLKTCHSHAAAMSRLADDALSSIRQDVDCQDTTPIERMRSIQWTVADFVNSLCYYQDEVLGLLGLQDTAEEDVIISDDGRDRRGPPRSPSSPLMNPMRNPPRSPSPFRSPPRSPLMNPMRNVAGPLLEGAAERFERAAAAADEAAMYSARVERAAFAMSNDREKTTLRTTHPRQKRLASPTMRPCPTPTRPDFLKDMRTQAKSMTVAFPSVIVVPEESEVEVEERLESITKKARLCPKSPPHPPPEHVLASSASASAAVAIATALDDLPAPPAAAVGFKESQWEDGQLFL